MMVPMYCVWKYRSNSPCICRENPSGRVGSVVNSVIFFLSLAKLVSHRDQAPDSEIDGFGPGFGTVVNCYPQVMGSWGISALAQPGVNTLTKQRRSRFYIDRLVGWFHYFSFTR